MLDKKELVKVAKVVAKAEAKDKLNPTFFALGEKKFTYSQVDDLLRSELKSIAPDYNAFRRNKLDLFELMQEVLDEIVPIKVIRDVGVVADVKIFKQGEKPTFKVKAGKSRAKKFITKAGLSSNYDTFTLDNTFVDITTTAYGGAGYLELERYLDGQVDFADIVEIVAEGLEDSLYKEIWTAMAASYSAFSAAANRQTGNAWDYAKFAKLATTVKAYGSDPTCMCFPEWAATIAPATSSWYNTADNTDMRERGYIGKVGGVNVVVMNQSFVDETNATKVFDPKYAFLMPSDERVVKVAIEGSTIVKDYEHRDGAMEISAFRKFGIAIMAYNNWAIFENTAVV